MSADPRADEQLGREWAARRGSAARTGAGIRPEARPTPPPPHRLPGALIRSDALTHGVLTDGWRKLFDSEAAAFAALGRAVHEVLHAVWWTPTDGAPPDATAAAPPAPAPADPPAFLSTPVRHR